MFTKRPNKKVLFAITDFGLVLILSILLQNCLSCYKAVRPISKLSVLLHSCPSCYKTVCPVTKLSVLLQSFPSYYKAVCPITQLSILLQNCPSYYKTVCPITKLSILLESCLSCYKAVHPVTKLFILLQNCPSSYKSVHPITKLSQPILQFLSHVICRPTATELLKHPFFKKAKENDFLVQAIIEKGPSFASRAKRVRPLLALYPE